MKFIALYQNGFPACDVEEDIEAPSLEEAREIAEENLSNYLDSYDYIIDRDDYDTETEYEDALDNYYADGTVTVTEKKEE